MTWSLWLKIYTSKGFTGERYYISSGGQTGIARGVAFLYKSTTNEFELHVRTATFKMGNKYQQSQIPLQSWFHLALTIEMKMFKLYVDGELMNENNINTQGGSSVDGCTRLYLGMTNTCRQAYKSDTYSGSAAYSNLMVFDRLLNQDEIKNLMQMKK